MADETPQAEPQKVEGQFDLSDPVDAAKYWAREFQAARDEGSEDWPGITSWQEKGRKVVHRFRAQKKGSRRANDSRIHIFPANVITQRAILVGNTPKCEVTRRHDDADDDVARVASDMLERILNSGLEEESKGLSFVLSRCVEDRLLPGMGVSRVHFGCEFVTEPEKPAIMAPCPTCQGTGAQYGPSFTTTLEQPEPPPLEPGYGSCPQCDGAGQIQQAPAVPAQEAPANETADVSYVHWQDHLWSACRTPADKRWEAYSAEMSRKQLADMFEEGSDPRIPAVTKNRGREDGTRGKESPWKRFKVWEIWSKEHKRVFWFIEGFNRTLTNTANPTGEDPLHLEDFFPSPVPLMANATTDAFLPVPDYVYAEDLYEEADELTARIRGIVKAIKVAGVCDKNARGLSRLLDEACELELIPVGNWAEFMKNGGIGASFQLLPVKDMVDTVQALVVQRNLVIESIYQVTGLGDIIRGQQQQTETATTSAIKARYASVRLQDLQKEVARYATDAQRLRKEVIAKHWSIRTIIDRSCIMRSAEAQTLEGQQRIMAAAQLIKDKHLDFLVAVKPEQVSLQDWAQLKQQRTEVLTALGQYFQSMMPFLQSLGAGGPEAVKAGLQLVLRNAQWLVAGMPGAGAVESAIDSFVAQVEKPAQQAAQQPPAQPKPDPKVIAAGIKAQGDVAKTQAATQGRLIEITAETRAKMAERQHDAAMDVATQNATSEARMRLDALRSVDAVTGQGGMGR